MQVESAKKRKKLPNRTRLAAKIGSNRARYVEIQADLRAVLCPRSGDPEASQRQMTPTRATRSQKPTQTIDFYRHRSRPGGCRATLNELYRRLPPPRKAGQPYQARTH